MATKNPGQCRKTLVGANYNRLSPDCCPNNSIEMRIDLNQASQAINLLCEGMAIRETTPAVASGLTDRVWSIRELLEKTEATLRRSTTQI